MLRDLGRAIVPLARNVASVRLPMLLARNPVFVVWAVTEACNLGCAHCDLNRPLPDELDHAHRLSVAHRLAASDVWGVSFIGGEPLLVSGVFEYAGILKAAGKRVFLGTSGDRLARVADSVLETGIDVVTVSIEGATAESHDAFRRRPGLFARVVDAIETLRARRRDGVPRIQIRVTINRRNLREVGDIVEFWQPRADNVLLQIVQNNGLHQVRDPNVLFRPEDRTEFECVLSELRERFPFLKGSYYDLMSRYVFEPDALYRDIGFRCLLVPATMFVVGANGRVRLCHGRPDSDIGSIVDQDLEQLWRGEQAVATRDTMQSKEFGCMCWESQNAHNLDLVQMSNLYDSLERHVSGVIERVTNR
jgi:MoaA/NifB/PqqE/SkfB family radical SAM enzyme